MSELHQEMTTREVAAHYGLETRDVVSAARRGLLDPAARKVGWIWIFDGSKLPETWPVKKRGAAA